MPPPGGGTEIPMKEKISLRIWLVFLAGMGAALLFILFESMRHPIDYIDPAVFLKIPFFYLLFFIFLVILTTLLRPFLEKYEKILLPAVLFIYGIFLYWICAYTKGIPVHDSALVVEGARHMAGLSDVIAWTYFSRFHNNIMPMVYLSVLFRIGHVLGFKDPYYFALIFNVLGVLLAMFCVFLAAKSFKKHGTEAGWISVILLGSYFPVFGHTQSMYTDAFSLSYGIAGFTLWMWNQKNESRLRNYLLWDLAAAILWAVGMQLKATAVIPMIAVSLYCLLFKKWKKSIVDWLCLWIPVILTIVVCSRYARTLPCEEYRDTWEYPAVGYFIALGLENDGTFNLESPYISVMCGIYGLEEKRAYTSQYIRDNFGQFFNRQHIVAKLSQNFSSGTMLAREFLWSSEHKTFVSDIITGEKCVRYRVEITRYWFLLLFLMAAGCFTAIVKKDRSPQIVVAFLSVCGVFLYLMLGEADNRLLYNHLPWYVLCADVGIWGITDLLCQFFQKITRKKEAADKEKGTEL